MQTTLKKRIHYFNFFKKYLKEKVFFVVVLNILVGLLDGLGLSMFLPLLYIVAGQNLSNNAGNASAEEVTTWVKHLGFKIDLQTVLVLLVVFFALKGVAYYLKGAYQVATQQYFIKKIRLSSIQSLNETSYEYFASCDQGKIHNMLTAEIDKVARACQSYFLAFQHLILVLVYIAFAFFLNWKFACMVCVGGLLVDFVYGRIYRKTKSISRQITDG
ncbi:MAG: ABC transporter ATP-binding protein, partial [Pedobacter sp.]